MLQLAICALPLTCTLLQATRARQQEPGNKSGQKKYAAARQVSAGAGAG